jgi:palmitoyltransferase ZDHHC9/14/18
MSSQRLQAQRGQRPTSIHAQNPGQLMSGQTPVHREETAEDAEDDDGDSQAGDVQRTASQKRTGPSPLGIHPDRHARPVSRGTDITDLADPHTHEILEMPDRTTANTSPFAETVRSHGESEAPLQQDRPSQSTKVPARLDLSRLKGSTSNLPADQRSPRSFRSSLLINSRGDNSRNSYTSIPGRQLGHEKLPSNASSPQTQADLKAAVKRELKKNYDMGKNYEYFTGNTRFFMGGRFQNTRDRPINAGTFLGIIVTAVLFFVFEYVYLSVANDHLLTDI